MRLRIPRPKIKDVNRLLVHIVLLNLMLQFGLIMSHGVHPLIVRIVAFYLFLHVLLAALLYETYRAK